MLRHCPPDKAQCVEQCTPHLHHGSHKTTTDHSLAEPVSATQAATTASPALRKLCDKLWLGRWALVPDNRRMSSPDVLQMSDSPARRALGILCNHWLLRFRKFCCPALKLSKHLTVPKSLHFLNCPILYMSKCALTRGRDLHRYERQLTNP